MNINTILGRQKLNWETPNLKLRSELHISRKIFHALGVAVILVLFHQLNYQQAVLTSALMCAIFIPLDFWRIKSPKVQSFFMRFAQRWMRSNEIQQLTAASYLFAGTFIVVSLFPKKIAVLSLILLGIGDPVSSIFGVMYGKDKLIGNKSLQGSLAGFIACSIAAFVFYYSNNLMSERIILVSLLTGAIAALAELIPIGKIDDNFSIPVVSAVMLWILFNIFGGFAVSIT